ncbi:MAG: sortase [Anaerolineae bacterium]
MIDGAMNEKIVPVLSRAMLIVGGLLILAGLGWGVWVRVNAPPDPTYTDAGAVVLAETAPPRPTATVTSSPTPTPLPTLPAVAYGPPPELLPDLSASATPTPTAEIRATVEPTEPPRATPSPTATPIPTPTPIPAAEDPPTRIVAPSIDLDAKVVPMGWEQVTKSGTMVSEWVVPKNAAGWHMNSSLPGHQENVVLSGHHNIEGKVFRYVVDLKLGDKITLYVDDTPYEYLVTAKYILKEAGMPLRVRKKNAQWILPTGDERLTLVTCWPYEWPGNSHRVIVVARPPNYVEPNLDIIQ